MIVMFALDELSRQGDMQARQAMRDMVSLLDTVRPHEAALRLFEARANWHPETDAFEVYAVPTEIRAEDCIQLFQQMQAVRRTI